MPIIKTSTYMTALSGMRCPHILTHKFLDARTPPACEINMSWSYFYQALQATESVAAAMIRQPYK